MKFNIREFRKYFMKKFNISEEELKEAEKMWKTEACRRRKNGN
jgi:hypothetical protein